MSHAWTLLARMPDRSIGGILTGGAFELTLRHNAVGSWRLTQPRERTPAGWPAPGCGLIILNGVQVIASGEWDQDDFEWSADPDSDQGGAGVFSLSGDTDLARIGYRTIYPTPARGWGSGQGDYYTDRQDHAETAIRRLVDSQAGPGALPERRVAGLTTRAGTGLGGPISVRERFTGLLDALRKIADASPGQRLGFDVVDRLDGSLDLTVRAPRDLSRHVRFGIELGNVTELKVSRTAPTGNVALVAGGGELDSRSLHEYRAADDDLATWGRREILVDQRQVGTDADQDGADADQQAEYDKAGREAIDDGREQTAVTATVIDSPAQQWGRDYDVGDQVGILTPWGDVVDLVREITISVDETGATQVSTVIGSAEQSADDPLAETVRTIAGRVSQLERGL